MRFHVWLHFLQSFVWNGHYMFHYIVPIYSRRFHVWLDSLQSFVWNSTCMFTLCSPYVHIWLYSLQSFVWNRQHITIMGPAVCGKLEEFFVLSWCTKLLNPILLGRGGGRGKIAPLLFFLHHPKTAQCIKLKLSDFEVTGNSFIIHKLEYYSFLPSVWKWLECIRWKIGKEFHYPPPLRWWGNGPTR